MGGGVLVPAVLRAGQITEIGGWMLLTSTLWDGRRSPWSSDPSSGGYTPSACRKRRRPEVPGEHLRRKGLGSTFRVALGLIDNEGSQLSVNRNIFSYAELSQWLEDVVSMDVPASRMST
jgi:hypothetical protein